MRLKNLANTPPAETCRNKSNLLINLVVNAQDDPPARVCEPNIKKAVELIPEGAENIMDILNAKPNPAECMVLSLSLSFFFVFFGDRGIFSFQMCILPSSPLHTSFFFRGESDDVNFKEGLAHIPLPSGSQCFPSIGRIPSFDKDLFDSRS